jgi:hypothetical protein
VPFRAVSCDTHALRDLAGDPGRRRQRAQYFKSSSLSPWCPVDFPFAGAQPGFSYEGHSAFVQYSCTGFLAYVSQHRAGVLPHECGLPAGFTLCDNIGGGSWTQLRRRNPRIKSPLLCCRIPRYYLRLHARTSEDMTLTCEMSYRIMTAAASPYWDIRANMERTSNPEGLDHCGNHRYCVGQAVPTVRRKVPPDPARAEDTMRNHRWIIAGRAMTSPRSSGGLEDGLEVAEVFAVGASHGHGHKGHCDLGESARFPAVAQRHPG